jgi:hypothetical protein
MQINSLARSSFSSANSATSSAEGTAGSAHSAKDGMASPRELPRPKDWVAESSEGASAQQIHSRKRLAEILDLPLAALSLPKKTTVPTVAAKPESREVFEKRRDEVMARLAQAEALAESLDKIADEKLRKRHP